MSGYAINGDPICASCANDIKARSIAPLNQGTCACCGDSWTTCRDPEWRQEIAMEEGMLHGIAAYNDAMGYCVENPEQDWGPEEWDRHEEEQTRRASRKAAYLGGEDE